MKKLIWFLILSVFVTLSFGCEEKVTRISSIYPNDLRTWEHIFSKDSDFGELNFESAPLGVILPHHMVVAHELSAFYKSLSETTQPSTIFIIGSNHFENGEWDIQTCESCIYSTVNGDVVIDTDLTEALVESGIGFYNDEAFIDEHSIHSHTPYIKKYFPDAKIVPIIIQWEISVDIINNLSEWIDENLPENSLILASVDFSHYQNEETSDFHDQAAYATIRNFDFSNIYDLEIDSPSTIYALLSLMEKRGYMKAERIFHTNSADFFTDHLEITTSHQFFAFFEGEKKPYKGVSLLNFGNVTKDEALTFNTSWNWDRDYDEKTDNSSFKFLRDIRGTEDRFLVGADYLVFDLPDNQCLSEEQNEMKVSFCKFFEDEVDTAILSAKAMESDLLYLLLQYQGDSEISDERKERIKGFADLGVDIFVGRGNKELVPFEYYNGSLLFYSLGDFITNNKLATDIDASSVGTLIGLHVTPEFFNIYHFPIEVNNGYPKLKDYSVRADAFLEFVRDYKLGENDIMDSQNGFIKIKR